MNKITFTHIRDMAKAAQREWNARIVEVARDFRDLIANHARSMRRLGHSNWDTRWMVRVYKGTMRFEITERNER